MVETQWKQQFTQFKDSNKSLSQLLISGELVLADYMKWATENYKIPLLNDNFFAQTNNHKLVVENSLTPWSEFFFPIHEWQGMLYIGCIEPLAVTISKKHCLVLCSPSQLSALWTKMEKPVAANGAKLNTPDKQVVPTSHLQTEGVKVNPNFSETNYDIPEITNVVRSSKLKGYDTNFTNTKTIMPFPDRSTQFTFIRTVYSDQVIIEANAKIQENTDPQDALISAFKILKDYYKKLMWVVRDEKGYAYPIACNTDWEFTEEAWNLPMDFKTPNPFRTAKLTQKPYHGPIVKNQASDIFFKQWGDGTYPETMSIVPVKLNGKVFGYFVGCEKGSHFQENQSIELIESVCNELITTFICIHKELANKAS